MCGICGFTGPDISGLIASMTGLLAHRGPDGEGFYSDSSGGVQLGHRRLSIIDIAMGAQPMSNEDETIWIVFNGEIYNYLELRSRLVAAGHVFRTTSDTEVLLHLYEDEGEDLCAHLNGMFAFAIWDGSRGRLLVARDRLGVKPLYWTMTRRRFVFASELPVLLRFPGVTREIEPRAFALYLGLRHVPEPMTVYRGVNALLPGHVLVWDREKTGVELRRYWYLDFSRQGVWRGEEELCDQIEALLLDATRIRMRSDVPVGAFLSGGIDSSLVVALARRFHSGRLHTFSLAYADRPQDKNDAHYAARLASLWGTEHHEHVMSASDVPEALGDVIRHFGQPFAGVLSTYFLSAEVARTVKVALTGDGADDQFGSYGHHRLVWPLDRLHQAMQKGVVDSLAMVDLSPLTGRADFVKGFMGLEPWQWRARFGAFPDEMRETVLSDSGRDMVRSWTASSFFEEFWRRATAVDPLNRMLEVDVQTLLPNEVLCFADRLSMAHALELRSPFLDYRLAELAASIPGTFKIRGDSLKYILRKTAARHLPQEILDRPKEGFVMPNHVWLRGQHDELLGDLLAPSELKRHGLFDPEGVARIVQEHRQGVRDHAFRIWTLVMFQVWYQEFMVSPSWPVPWPGQVPSGGGAGPC